MPRIPFNNPPLFGLEESYIHEVVSAHKICGDGPMTKRCRNWLQEHAHSGCALLTTSGTAALEMAALLCDIRPGDEVIMPSYTFSSTANAFVLRGATIVFVDIRPDTMNIDESLIEDAITERTKAVVAVHYAGVSCEMDTICQIADRHGLYVVEDAAQGVMSTYRSKPLGSIGDFGCYSFHETKNYSMGEGGAILINRPDCVERAEILREKGTDRSKFLRGQIDKYTWTDIGSSYLPSELNAAYLMAQLDNAEEINRDRLRSWNHYHEGFLSLAAEERLELPFVPPECGHNAHMYYIKLKDIEERSRMIKHLNDADIGSAFHYIPLHSSPAGIRFGRFHGTDRYTTSESERLLRLPMYFGLPEESVSKVIETVYSFFR